MLHQINDYYSAAHDTRLDVLMVHHQRHDLYRHTVDDDALAVNVWKSTQLTKNTGRSRAKVVELKQDRSVTVTVSEK